MTERPNKPDHRWLVLITVIIGTFLGSMDQTVVNLALPKIIQAFSISVSSAGWIATAYILANAVFVPVWGKLGDTIGRKKVYLFGFSIFIIGSLLAGLAWNFSSLIIFRIIQAVAASADYPTAMAIIAATFPLGKERTQALGLWSTAFAGAMVVGPLVGGPLIDNFSWRAIFFINIPVGIVGIIMATMFIRESVADKGTKVFDWWGAITLGITLSVLVLVLDRGLTWGWFSLSSVLCYITVIVFALVFHRIEQHIAEPIIDFKFFKINAFTQTLLNNFIVFMGMMGSMFLIPIFASTFMGLSATQTGILYIPMALMMVIASPLGGSFAGKVQPRFIIAPSTAIAALGLFLFSVFLDPHASTWAIIVPLSVLAFGMGFGMAQRTSVIAAVVPENEMGVASSILALARNIAGAFGIALFGTILQNAETANAFATAHWSVLHSTQPGIIQEFIALVELKAQIVSYMTVFRVAAVIVLIGAALSLFIIVKETRQDGKAVFID